MMSLHDPKINLSIKEPQIIKPINNLIHNPFQNKSLTNEQEKIYPSLTIP